MSGGTLRQFAEAMLAAEPGITMGAQEIESSIKEFGLEHFLRNAGSQAAELAEAAELLLSMDGGG